MGYLQAMKSARLLRNVTSKEGMDSNEVCMTLRRHQVSTNPVVILRERSKDNQLLKKPIAINVLTINLTHLQYILVEVIISVPLMVTTEFAVPYVGYSSISLGAAATEALCTASNMSNTIFDMAATRRNHKPRANKHRRIDLVLCRATE
jgi:hypothetical protein